MSQHWSDLDHQYIWHPYSERYSQSPIYPIEKAEGVYLTLADGRELIDGMSSWWSAIHGYNHPVMNQALKTQIDQFSHIMFGGLTHQPACLLAEKLIEITPESLKHVFFIDSGSVAVEVSMKMAIQYWFALKQPQKQKFITIRKGYHGDTFGAMSVCDPTTGMHSLFNKTLPQQIFVDAVQSTFDDNALVDADLKKMEQALAQNHQNIAAIILEPIVQGAGRMYFYSAEYLNQLKPLAEKFNVLLIFDEIATGFGRTGELFAMNHTHITPDIVCLGKSLTAGYMTLAATLTTDKIADTISNNPPQAFMHGPTFMANPLACVAALTSIDLLLAKPWQKQIKQLSQWLKSGLFPCVELPQVKEIRVLGAIGVVELKFSVSLVDIQSLFVNQGVWVRPFGRLVYLMPPFIINENDIKKLTSIVYQIVSKLKKPTHSE